MVGTKHAVRPVAIVTGAGGGIGTAIAVELARRDYRLVLIDRDEGALARTQAATAAEATEVVDLRDTAAAVAAVRARAEQSGRLDLLVNNAGLIHPAGLFAHTPDQFDEMFAVNAKAPFFCLQAAAEFMRAQGSGCIINVASTSGLVASPHPSIGYDMSKAAVCLLTAAAARELGPLGIRVCGVAPGTTDTPMVASITGDPARLESALAAVPLGRIGRPEEIAAVIGFLASPEASYVNGQTWVVDGGRIA